MDQKVTIKYSLRISSPFSERSIFQGAGSEPAYTTWKVRPPNHEAKMTIDFIFHSPKLTPIRKYGLPELVYPGLPNSNYPSDHLALAAEFLLV
jgi:hypothetical protein